MHPKTHIHPWKVSEIHTDYASRSGCISELSSPGQCWTQHSPTPLHPAQPNCQLRGNLSLVATGAGGEGAPRLPHGDSVLRAASPGPSIRVALALAVALGGFPSWVTGLAVGARNIARLLPLHPILRDPWLSSTMGIEAGSPAAASPWTPVSSPLRPSGSTE
ncbi:hypothetical protein PCANC_04830 [Puccinia coronata f. sp. avenae]|uniref:Uncharacterized protein n=1 Tax=Puccinia coronata f. sp. avenae TaxID=200324 RepID=A0A2N5VCH7_9BASI|nr:hypothetical protein PCASD_04091 [Puccinia coronata f. sp. avenae]PLW56510.1 hypothetical protein PCANC_04830 [Puccinia coronata f. sp. avenae]